ncbi:MAG: OmpA family protein [Deltaproteobacteria bacterium]
MKCDRFPLVLASFLAATSVVLGATRADAQFLARLRLDGEVMAGHFLPGGTYDRFGVGFEGALRLAVVVAGPLSVRVGGETMYFTVPGQDQVPPGRMSAAIGGLAIRIPLGSRAIGEFGIDANAGLAWTGPLRRLTFDIGLAWELRPVEAVGIGVGVRYVRIVQPDDDAVPDDAEMLFAGLSFRLRVPSSAGRAIEDSSALERDTDGDGVPDARDRCFEEREDRDGIADDDGCPETDADQDGVLDGSDRCPLAPETMNGIDDTDGCPDGASPAPGADGATVITDAAGQRIQVNDTIQFDTDSAVLLQPSFVLLDAIVTLLGHHAEITQLLVVGHADDTGTAVHNRRLSAQRAGVVALYLRMHAARGVLVRSVGRGDTEPRCHEATDACRSLNRRVEFIILPGEHAAAPVSSSATTPSRPVAPASEAP